MKKFWLVMDKIFWLAFVVWAVAFAAALLYGCAAGTDGLPDGPFDGAPFAEGTPAVWEGAGWVWSTGRCSAVCMAGGECWTAAHCVGDIGAGADAVVKISCRASNRVVGGLRVGPRPRVGDVVWTYGLGCRWYGGEPFLRPSLVVASTPRALTLEQWPGPVCGGDSGGAALDSEGRLVGIISRWVELPGARGLGLEVLAPRLGTPSYGEAVQ